MLTQLTQLGPTRVDQTDLTPPRSPLGARRGASNEPKSPQGARSGVRTSFSNAPRTILARSWLHLGSILVDLSSILDPQRVDSGGFSTLFRCVRIRAGELAGRRGDLWETCKNNWKTTGFYTFSTCPRLRARCEHRPKIVPNALLD